LQGDSSEIRDSPRTAPAISDEGSVVCGPEPPYSFDHQDRRLDYAEWTRRPQGAEIAQTPTENPEVTEAS